MRLASVVTALALVGCAAGGSSIDGGRGHGDGGMDAEAEDAGCATPCSPTEECVGGRCVSTASDGDHDGVPTDADCDDTNAGIGGIAERACSSACGPGVEQCMDGVWMACSAPAACDCHDGDPPRSLTCGNCGTQMQVCTAGRWVNSGTCTSEGACMPGTMSNDGPCGMCGSSMRTCQLDCTYGAATCVGSGECMAGATDVMSDTCGNCGTRTRSRTCDGTCHWGSFGAYSGCAGEGACSPGATRAGSCEGCSQQVCDGSCNWGGCTLRPGNACEWRSGTHWRCCGGSSWQFCLSSCQWSTACAACSGCGC